MRIAIVTAYAVLVGLVTPLSAQDAAQKPLGPCEQIVDACKKAGFIGGDYKNGNGLMGDCVNPIIRGSAQPTDAHIALPEVSADVVAACRTKHPNFGQRKMPQPKPVEPAPPSDSK
jgi:hypothetical protein